MRSASTRARPIGAVEVASSAVARLAPRALLPAIERTRHDVRALVDGLSGRREPAVTSPSSPRIVPVPLRAIDPIEHVLPRGARRTWVSLRTDVTWLLRDLRGEPRPNLIARGPSRYATARGLGAALRPLRVASITRETEDASSIALTELDGAPIAFEAGQFLTLHLTIDGAPVRRAYSLSTSPLSGVSAITVKRVGFASSFLHERLREGDVVRALGPSGAFLAPTTDDAAHLVMLAGGSGITPVLSIAETVLQARPALRVTLVYGNRRWRDVIFAERIERLRERHADRFEVQHVLSEPDASWTGRRGLLDRATIDACLDAIADGGPRLYYLCGPAPMREAARAALFARGVRDEQLREERFSSPAELTGAALPSEPVSMRVASGGRDAIVHVTPGQTLLEAGLAAGLRMPFSCAMGGCGACKVRLTSGQVSEAGSSCLSSREREAGYVLACSARPTGPVSIEVER